MHLELTGLIEDHLDVFLKKIPQEGLVQPHLVEGFFRVSLRYYQTEYKKEK